MATYSLDLMFLASDDHPGMAIAQVMVKTHTSRSEPPYKDAPLITPQAMGPAEIDYEIDRLQNELEQIRKKAHRKFKSQHERWRKAIQERSSD